ncbi:HBS1-like protein [Venturia canescens]|uniref:HBS1-like protein n=1 Tax=Venturia canescens TaxID=32260 RepID=UPI001C9D4633|nr:HBS1-like protein [Venturia canescens]
MSRHRDVRSMKYSDEYDGYDDVYGHSVDDDYNVSPEAEEFLFDRNKQQNISSFLVEPAVAKSNESVESKEQAPNKAERAALSEKENAQLKVCMETVRNVIGDSVLEEVLVEKVIQHNFNAEAVLNDVLNETPPKETSMAKEHLEAHAGIKQNLKTPNKLPPATMIRVTPAATRSVIKGFEVKNSENSDLLNTPRVQSPASDRSSPGSRRKEELLPKKWPTSKPNTPRCQSPISGRATPENETRKSHEDKRDVTAIYKDKRGDSKDQLHLVVVGHVDAGKSTLLGRLLCDLGYVPSKLMHKYQRESKKIGKQSFAYAWVLDETGEERERGITMDVGYSKFETETKSVAILDAPGHRDFIPNMIMGATQADVALLVVDATRGEFESGFDSGGQTREHALLLRSLGVSQLAIVVNKLDTVDWSKERFDEIVEKLSLFLKQAGFKETVTFVPCSGLSGENLIAKPTAEGLSSWYNGPTLLSVIDRFKCPERPISKPFRFSVNDIFKGTGSGFCVSGHIETGMVAVGDKVLLLPANQTAVIKGILADETATSNGFAGDHVSLTIAGIEQQNVAVGDVICSISNPVPVTTCFQAHVVIFSATVPVIKGLPVILHQQSLVEPATITKLIAQLHKSSGEVIKKKPRCLPKNCSAIIEVQTQRPVPMELYRDIEQLGRVMLRVSGVTVAAGLVTKIN